MAFGVGYDMIMLEKRWLSLNFNLVKFFANMVSA